MNKSELTQDMKKYCGGSFINRQQLAVYLGFKDPHSVDRFLHGLECISGKRYFVPDVAKSLKEKSTF